MFLYVTKDTNKKKIHTHIDVLIFTGGNLNMFNMWIIIIDSTRLTSSWMPLPQWASPY